MSETQEAAQPAPAITPGLVSNRELMDALHIVNGNILNLEQGLKVIGEFIHKVYIDLDGRIPPLKEQVSAQEAKDTTQPPEVGRETEIC